MEREILIANTRTQKRSKITTAATTLGELKAALTEAGIDYSDMTFTEGVSKTQLLSDDTQLPQNVMYKGRPTNDLVILLTNTKKKIASGGDRTTAYQAVKDNNLQDAVKEHFGRNFTQVPTDALWDFIGDKVNKPAVMEEVEESPAKESWETDFDKDTFMKDKEKAEIIDVEKTEVPTKAASGIFFMVTHFLKAGILTVKEAKNLAKNIMSYAEDCEEEMREWNTPSEPVSTSDGNITDNDIDDMINDIL